MLFVNTPLKVGPSSSCEREHDLKAENMVGVRVVSQCLDAVLAKMTYEKTIVFQYVLFDNTKTRNGLYPDINYICL